MLGIKPSIIKGKKKGNYCGLLQRSEQVMGLQNCLLCSLQIFLACLQFALWSKKVK